LKNESSNLKSSYKRDKQENERISRNLVEKEDDLKRTEQSLKLEKELINKERESLDLKLKEIESKSSFIAKMN